MGFILKQFNVFFIQESVSKKSSNLNDIYYNPMRKVYGDASLCHIATSSFSCSSNKLCRILHCNSEWCFVNETCLPKTQIGDCMELIIKKRAEENNFE